jgi:hypothetical protein
LKERGSLSNFLKKTQSLNTNRLHRLCRKSEIKDEKTELKEEDEFELVKQDQESEDDDKGEAKEEADIRDIRYNLETLSSNNHIIFFSWPSDIIQKPV